MLIQGGPREINPATISRNLYLSNRYISVNRASITEVEERDHTSPYLSLPLFLPSIDLINLLTADRYIWKTSFYVNQTRVSPFRKIAQPAIKFAQLHASRCTSSIKIPRRQRNRQPVSPTPGMGRIRMIRAKLLTWLHSLWVIERMNGNNLERTTCTRSQNLIPPELITAIYLMRRPRSCRRHRYRATYPCCIEVVRDSNIR